MTLTPLARELRDVWRSHDAIEDWNALAAHVEALLQAQRDACPGCGHEPTVSSPQPTQDAG
jgi:hypothetical protein